MTVAVTVAVSVPETVPQRWHCYFNLIKQITMKPGDNQSGVGVSCWGLSTVMVEDVRVPRGTFD